MLILGRRAGEGIHIGNNHIRVNQINPGYVRLEIKAFPSQWIRIGDGISFKVTRVEPEQVKIGIRAPRQINIVRSELLNSDPAALAYT